MRHLTAAAVATAKTPCTFRSKLCPNLTSRRRHAKQSWTLASTTMPNDGGRERPQGDQMKTPHPTTPPPSAVEEAKCSPSGYVYQIDGEFTPDDYVPPERIVGMWKVDALGDIIGAFIQIRISGRVTDVQRRGRAAAHSASTRARSSFVPNAYASQVAPLVVVSNPIRTSSPMFPSRQYPSVNPSSSESPER
jgi:hypothetical protein